MVESDQQHIFGARTQQHLIFESHGHQVIELSTDTWTDGIIKVDQNPSKATVRDHMGCHPSQSTSENVRG